MRRRSRKRAPTKLDNSEGEFMSNRALRRAYAACAASIVAMSVTGVASAQASDPVIFSFATVGDSRTDPGKPDATTLLANPNPATQGGVPSLTGTILPQDNEWVQNTQAFGAILEIGRAHV